MKILRHLKELNTNSVAEVTVYLHTVIIAITLMISLQPHQHIYSAIKWIYSFKVHEKERVLTDFFLNDVFCHLDVFKVEMNRKHD